MKYVAALAIILLAFAVPGINFYHHVEFPNLVKDKITTERFADWAHVRVGTKTTIRLGTEIKAPEHYKDVERVLQEAQIGDEVVFHLSGYGGEMITETELTANVRMSKAFVTMVVDAPVYSAHAYLAVSGDRLVMAKYSFLMFHMAAIAVNDEETMISQVDCTSLTGVDRGVPNSEHCMALKRAMMISENAALEDIKLLTRAEKDRLYTGNDVYLFPDDIKMRQLNISRNQ